MASTEARSGGRTVKKLLFWTAVIVGILAAAAVVMKRRSGSEDDAWQGYLEESKGLVPKAANEGAKDVVDLTADTSKDVAGEAKDVAAKAKRANS
jgi:hypothetical protein